jgi:hypothetical protein
MQRVVAARIGPSLAPSGCSLVSKKSGSQKKAKHPERDRTTSLLPCGTGIIAVRHSPRPREGPCAHELACDLGVPRVFRGPTNEHRGPVKRMLADERVTLISKWSCSCAGSRSAQSRGARDAVGARPQPNHVDLPRGSSTPPRSRKAPVLLRAQACRILTPSADCIEDPKPRRRTAPCNPPTTRIPCRERPARGRKVGPPGDRRIFRRCENSPQRVPTFAPGVADTALLSRGPPACGLVASDVIPARRDRLPDQSR